MRLPISTPQSCAFFTLCILLAGLAWSFFTTTAEVNCDSGRSGIRIHLDMGNSVDFTGTCVEDITKNLMVSTWMVVAVSEVQPLRAQFGLMDYKTSFWKDLGDNNQVVEIQLYGLERVRK